MVSFKGKHFKQAIILMLVRWYLAYSLSYRDIEELALERGLKIDHSTVNRWVIEYAPPLETSFLKAYKRPAGYSWKMDETYVKVKGTWTYLYRAVDESGQTVDFFFSEKRDTQAASRFFYQAISSNGVPKTINLDKSSANKAGIDKVSQRLILKKINVRQIKYLNHRIEQDHRFVKKIIQPMKGFKAFHSAKATLAAGIELHHMLRKAQHNTAENQTIFEQFYGLSA